ncbi:hypothetical protein WICPIJ_006722 [Wickerhamomyces pijperi]|uniref:Telomere-associated protein Rif1 N-terminal domain-containing protein n=1 Tax=Wickerhamomyces pijperi TaxID=599730 RepID=A0A9P8Q160_WICPI|nr:hypothetical protein WICPIJ_006722 [Wickerhamomyces pijperi]
MFNTWFRGSFSQESNSNSSGGGKREKEPTSVNNRKIVKNKNMKNSNNTSNRSRQSPLSNANNRKEDALVSSATPTSITKPQKGVKTRTSTAKSRTVDGSPSDSPLLRKSEQMYSQSSPIKKSSNSSQGSGSILPSPSPEKPDKLSKSSPLKQRTQPSNKKVIFSDNLVMDETSPIVKTPRRSILKQTQLMQSTPPMMNPLLVRTTTPKNKMLGTFCGGDPSTLEFWTPGNIPTNSPAISRAGNGIANSAQQEIASFRSLFHGGLKVLQIDNCARQFEIYATFSLLLKNVNEKSNHTLTVLLPLMPQLVNCLWRDLQATDSKIFEADQASNSDLAFAVRINVQILKIFSVLVSNNRLIVGFWNKSQDNLQIARKVILRSSDKIQNPMITKSLLTANLQLIRDIRVTICLSAMQDQERLLYSVLNMKFILSSSILSEKLYTLKSLIIRFPQMMSKNVKSWLPFLLNCGCDSDQSQLSLKTLNTAVVTLLEVSKVFLNDSKVQFEFKFLLNQPIEKTLNFELTQSSSSLPSTSTPLDLGISTMGYLIKQITRLVSSQETVKIGMDLWFGLTLIVYNDKKYLHDNFIDLRSNKWFSFILKAIQDDETPLWQVGSICKYYRVIPFLMVNAMGLGEDSEEYLTKKLDLMFEILLKHNIQRHFTRSDPSNIDVSPLLDLCSVVLYSVVNNPNIVITADLITRYLMPLFDVLDQLSEVSQDAIYYKTLLFLQLFSSVASNGTVAQQIGKFQLIRTLTQYDGFEMKDIRPLSAALAKNTGSAKIFLDSFPVVFDTFTRTIWNNENITLKIKLNILTNVTMKLKPALAQATMSTKSITTAVADVQKQVDGVLTEISKFVKHDYYRFLDTSCLEFINKLTVILRNSFGNRLVYRFDANDDDVFVYNAENYYVTSIKTLMQEKKMKNDRLSDFKIIGLFKWNCSLIKQHQWKYFDALYLEEEESDSDSDADSDQLTINKFIISSLCSKQPFVDLSASDIKALYSLVRKIKDKSHSLLTPLLTYITQPNITPQIIDFQEVFHDLRITSWDFRSVNIAVDIVSDSLHVLGRALNSSLIEILSADGNVEKLSIYKNFLTVTNLPFCVSLKNIIIWDIFQNITDTGSYYEFSLQFFDYVIAKGSSYQKDEILYYSLVFLENYHQPRENYLKLDKLVRESLDRIEDITVLKKTHEYIQSVRKRNEEQDAQDTVHDDTQLIENTQESQQEPREEPQEELEQQEIRQEDDDIDEPAESSDVEFHDSSEVIEGSMELFDTEQDQDQEHSQDQDQNQDQQDSGSFDPIEQSLGQTQIITYDDESMESIDMISKSSIVQSSSSFDQLQTQEVQHHVQDHNQGQEDNVFLDSNPIKPSASKELLDVNVQDQEDLVQSFSGEDDHLHLTDTQDDTLIIESSGDAAGEKGKTLTAAQEDTIVSGSDFSKDIHLSTTETASEIISVSDVVKGNRFGNKRTLAQLTEEDDEDGDITILSSPIKKKKRTTNGIGSGSVQVASSVIIEPEQPTISTREPEEPAVSVPVPVPAPVPAPTFVESIVIEPIPNQQQQLMTTFNMINLNLDMIDKLPLDEMSTDQVYQVENKLLSLMMRMRKAQLEKPLDP